MTNTCQHTHTTESNERCYSGSVARPPYTEENPAAAGNICYDETCTQCGAVRAVNQNGRHSEVSPWGPTAAERQAVAANERRTAAEKQAEEDANILASRKTRIVGILPAHRDHNQQAKIIIDGREQILNLWTIDDAADQDDNGDGLVQFYAAMRRELSRIGT